MISRLVVVSSLLLIPAQLAARTWEVREDGSGDAPTVQAGIDSAAVGDTVLVEPGYYSEHLDFKGKSIVVRSEMGASMTVLDAAGIGTVVVFENGETRLTVLDGFTIRGGVGTTERPGGGFYIHDSEPTVRLNIIEDNESIVGSGGGIYCRGSIGGKVWSPLLSDNIIRNNRSRSQGGGLYAVNLTAPHIVGNEFSGNVVTRGDGGGISLRLVVDGAMVSDNLISNNVAGDHGGGIYIGLATNLRGPLDIEVSRNLVINNVAGGRSSTSDCGGGVWLSETNAWVHHNTIASNSCGIDRPAGGMVLRREGTPVVEANIIAFSTLGGGLLCHLGSTPIIRDNMTWQNTGGDGLGDCPGWWQTDGNIVADPYFCDADNDDYTLAENSPAITHVAGPLGAIPVSGCGPVSVNRTTWGRIKTLYR